MYQKVQLGRIAKAAFVSHNQPKYLSTKSQSQRLSRNVALVSWSELTRCSTGQVCGQRRLKGYGLTLHIMNRCSRSPGWVCSESEVCCAVQGSRTTRNISVTFARSSSVESTFSSTEGSGKVKEKEKKKSGGGGIALAMVYALKLGCYFIVQVRPPTHTTPAGSCCVVGNPMPAKQRHTPQLSEQSCPARLQLSGCSEIPGQHVL